MMNFLKLLFGSKDKPLSVVYSQNQKTDFSAEINKITLISDHLKKEREIDNLNSANPGSYYILIAAGFIFSNHGKYQRALEYYQEFVKRFTNDNDLVIGYYQLGVVYQKMGKYGEAIEAHNNAIKVNKFAFKSYNGLGDVYFSMKDYKKARDYYLRYYSQPKLKDDLVATQLANIEFELGNIALSLNYQLDAIRINPANRDYYFNLLSFYGNSKNYRAEVTKYLDSACQRFPDDYVLFREYARIRMIFSEHYSITETQEYAKKAFELNPKDIDTRIIYASIRIEYLAKKALSHDYEFSRDGNELVKAMKMHYVTEKKDISDLQREKIFISWALASAITGDDEARKYFTSMADELKGKRLGF